MKRLIILALMLLGAVANAQTIFPISDTTTTKTRLKGQLNVFTLTQDASGQTWIVTTPKSYKFNTDATVVPNSRTLGFSGADGISITGGTQNLTANRTWTIGISSIDASKIGGGAVSNIEYSYLDGVSSAIQTQIDTKAPINNPTFTGTVTMPSTNINTRRVATYTDLQAIVSANNFIGIVYVDTDSTNGNLASTYIVKNNNFQWVLSL